MNLKEEVRRHCTHFLVSLFFAAEVEELEDTIREVYQHSKDNRKEMGRLEGIRAPL